MSSVEGTARITQSNSPSFSRHCPGRRLLPARPAHRHHLHVEGFEPGLDELADRAEAEEQYPFTGQFALAGAIHQPLVPVLRTHNLAVALGVGEHQHDDIFRDGDRIDAHPIGHGDAAFLQQVERHEIEPGIDRIEPFEVRRGARNLGHRLLLVKVEPADFRLGSHLQRLLPIHEPQRLDPFGQARFDQRSDQGGQDGFGHLVGN